MSDTITTSVRPVYEFESGGHKFTIDLTKATNADGMVERIFRYGLRMFNDSANSAKARAEKKGESHDHVGYVETMISEFYAGQFTRTREAGGSDVDREYMILLVGWTVDAGAGKYTKAKVLETVKDKGADYVIERLAKARGVTVEELDKALTETAEANVKARKPTAKAVASIEL